MTAVEPWIEAARRLSSPDEIVSRLSLGADAPAGERREATLAWVAELLEAARTFPADADAGILARAVLAFAGVAWSDCLNANYDDGKRMLLNAVVAAIDVAALRPELAWVIEAVADDRMRAFLQSGASAEGIMGEATQSYLISAVDEALRIHGPAAPQWAKAWADLKPHY